MRNLILAAIAALLTTGVYADSDARPPLTNTTVAATSTTILPQTEARTTNVWATATAYSIGDYITSTNGLVYMAITAGTSSGATAPFSPDLDDTSDPNVTWRPVLRGKRNYFIIQNQGSETVWLSFGSFDAKIGYGISIPAGASLSSPIRPECFQGEINAISTNPVLLGIQLW